MQANLEIKASLRQRPVHSWWVDLLLLVWLGWACCFPWLWREMVVRERRQAARQRKEAKAAERKLMRQLARQGLC